MPDAPDKSVPGLMQDLVNQYTQLVRDEFALMRAEMNQKVSQVTSGATMLAVGAAFGLCALLILLAAAVIALSNVVAPWLAAVIVGVAAGFVALVMAGKGRSDLRTANLAPNRTMASVRGDARFTKEHVK